jgi:hypothetical protein
MGRAPTASTLRMLTGEQFFLLFIFIFDVNF